MALGGALVYAAAYTIELALSLTSYYSGSTKRVSAFLLAAGGVQAGGRVPARDVGRPRDPRPINKAVVYLWVGAAVTIVLGIWIMRFGLSLRPSRRQTLGESIYELVQGQIAEGNLPSKAINRWFPYVAALFLFIWVLNIVSFIPLPISNETLRGLRRRGPDLRALRGDVEPERDARASR